MERREGTFGDGAGGVNADVGARTPGARGMGGGDAATPGSPVRRGDQFSFTTATEIDGVV